MSELDFFEHTINSIIVIKPKVWIGDERRDDFLIQIHDLIVKCFNIVENHEYVPHISVEYVKTVCRDGMISINFNNMSISERFIEKKKDIGCPIF